MDAADDMQLAQRTANRCTAMRADRSGSAIRKTHGHAGAARSLGPGRHA